MKTLTKETINYFNECAVELTDCNNQVYKGWFVKVGKYYKLFPFSTIWGTYSFTLGTIKAIKHLTNNVQISK